MSHFDEKPYFSCVVVEGGIFFLAQHTNPVLKALGMWRRACAEKPNGGGSGLKKASRGCLIHAANAIEFYREQATSYGALHFYRKVRSSGSFVFTLKRRYFTESLSRFCSHLLLRSKLSSEGYPET